MGDGQPITTQPDGPDGAPGTSLHHLVQDISEKVPMLLCACTCVILAAPLVSSVTHTAFDCMRV